MPTRFKNSIALRFQEQIQPTLRRLPNPRLGRVLLLQMPQRSCLLQALSSDLQAPPSTITTPTLGPHDGPGSGVLSVQTVLPFGFSLNSRKHTNNCNLSSECQLTQFSRHAKTHSKPYACRVQPNCGFRFAEQRDRQRHEAGHGLQAQGMVQYFCPHDCERSPTGNEGGFGVREDNAKRHIRGRHGGSAMVPIRIIT
jgi:hypothetical protein